MAEITDLLVEVEVLVAEPVNQGQMVAQVYQVKEILVEQQMLNMEVVLAVAEKVQPALITLVAKVVPVVNTLLSHKQQVQVQVIIMLEAAVAEAIKQVVEEHPAVLVAEVPEVVMVLVEQTQLEIQEVAAEAEDKLMVLSQVPAEVEL